MNNNESRLGTARTDSQQERESLKKNICIYELAPAFK